MKKDGSRQRRALLAIIHTAKRDLGIEDETYRDLLEAEFKVRSAADLTIGQMERLKGIFQAWGFDPKGRRDRQAAALRARAGEIADRLPNGRRRLKGLVRRICGAEKLAWARDAEKLQRLVAALGKIEREYE